MDILIPNHSCKTLNDILYKHWRKVSEVMQEEKNLVYWRLMETRSKWKKMKGPVQITIIAKFKNQKDHDPDNLFVKPILDAMVLAGIIEDDNGEIVRPLIKYALRGQEQNEILINIQQL